MEPLICTVQEGQLKGQQDTDLQGTPFLSFMGVPYAKPPLGNLRFKGPLPPEKWEGIRDATKQGQSCVCHQMVATETGLSIGRLGSEDCLFLNVYTRKVLINDEDELKPVMVYFHGGGFVTGSSDRALYGPEFLMTGDIVLVTLNYRLGVLGFLSIDDPSLEVTGNAGLKDQIQALKWIQKNIKIFGGDPSNVTIFGESAGGASVHYLILSPLAKGLFHKAIMQSGTTLCPWARGVNDAKKLAKNLGCTETSNEKILAFLQQVSVEKIIDAQQELGDWLNPAQKRPFSPSIETKNENAVLTEEPLNLVQSGVYNHVPIMLGYASLEGFLEAWVGNFGFQANFKNLVPYFFGFQENSAEFKETEKKMAQFYFGKDEPDLDNKEGVFKFFTDASFLRGIYLAAVNHAKRSKTPVYYYRMSVETDLNMFKKMAPIDIKGVSHGDDIPYLFKVGNPEIKKGSVEEIAILRFVKLWSNFARTGNPTPVKDSLLNTEWKPISGKELNFLDIGLDLVPGTDPDIERMKFWDEISKGVEIRF